jgi:AcrR family transcriptional regulator
VTDPRAVEAEPRRRRGRPPKDASRDTRQLLLDAALELFAFKGFAATTVREIGARAGVHDSAIYFHFPSKEAMYDALFAEMGPPSLQEIAPAVDEMAALGPRAAITDLVVRLVESRSSPRGRRFASVVLREGSGRGGPAGLVSWIEVGKQRLAEPFRRWQQDGLVRADVPAEQLVWQLMAPLDLIWFMHLRADVPDEVFAAAGEIVDAHLSYFFLCTLIERQ